MEYSIKMVCAQLDIKPDTLRKWEIRGHIPPSRRKRNGYRYFSDEDMLKIENFLKDRFDKSQADPLPGAENKEVLFQSKKSQKMPINGKLIMEAIGQFNRIKLKNQFDQIAAKVGPLEALQNHWIPLLLELGDTAMAKKGLWVAQEHFTSSNIREWTLQLLKEDGQAGKEELIMTTPEGDMHELGMLFALCHLRLHKIKCLYVGPHLPLPSLIQTMEKTKINNISLTLNKPLGRPELRNILSKIKKQNPAANVLFAGPASFPLANLIQAEGGIFIGTNLTIGIKKIKELIQK